MIVCIGEQVMGDGDVAVDVIDVHPMVEVAGTLRPLLQACLLKPRTQIVHGPEVRKALGAAGMFRLADPVKVGGTSLRPAVMAAVG